MIALIAAMTLEAAPVVRRMSVQRREEHGGAQAVVGTLAGAEVALLTSGTGKEAAAYAARWALDAFTPKAMLCFGLAGGLRPEAQPSDLVFCSSVIAAANGATGRACAADVRLLVRAEDVAAQRRLRYVTGPCVTVSEVVTRPGDKARLGAAHQADAVEMESWWIAEAAAQKNVPFLAVRAISDSVDFRLPDTVSSLGDAHGNARPLAVMAYLLTHPHHVPLLWRLRRHHLRATQNLASFLEALAPQVALS